MMIMELFKEEKVIFGMKLMLKAKNLMPDVTMLKE